MVPCELFLGAADRPPTDRAKPGGKRHVICDGNGIPLVIQLTGANRNDSWRALSRVDAIPLLQGERGRLRPWHLIGWSHRHAEYDFQVALHDAVRFGLDRCAGGKQKNDEGGSEILEEHRHEHKKIGG